ncbi:MAG: zinc-dependent metalloprotease [Bacteroidota bacterium]
MNKRLAFIALLFLGCATLSNSIAQRKKKSASTINTSVIASKTNGMKKYEGFFNFYYNEKEDKILLEVDKFDHEFLYVNSLAAGVGSNDIGLDRNQLGNERVVKFDRRGPKILLVQPNYRYRALSDNEDERKAVEDAFAKSVLWGFKLITEENGKVLVDATDFLMQDAHNVIGRLKNSRQGNYSLDKNRSAFYLERTKNFQKNSEFETTLTFKGSPAGRYIRSVTPTNTSFTVRQHHSFVELPDDEYIPRKFDPRAGYYATMYMDYATPISEDIEKRFITRHRLKKKDPTAAISEAVEPIVYYLDRGTPEPIRSALLDGARWWNQAFEAAGYKDAFQVKILPEDADPMDVRYNVINWVHRSTRGWSYGTSVTDPRTGEIIKGHVLLGSLRVRQDFLIAEGLLAPYEDGTEVPAAMQEMALARLRQLSAHEVGHTIGLAHSYASSTEGRASVMDYPHPVAEIKDGKIDLSNAYDGKIGAWDKVSVAYGYQDFPKGANENEELEKIIQKSFIDGLTFISDQDARPQSGAHPYAHLWDNGQNASEELMHVLEVRKIALENFGVKNIRKGVPFAKLEEVLVPIYFYHRYQTEAAVKLIGGLDYRYALRGDGQFTTKFIDKFGQMKAMDALMATLSPEHLLVPEEVIKIIPPRPMGYSRSREIINIRTGVTFDPIGAAESAANMTLSLLLNPARAQRLVEHAARTSEVPNLNEILDKLISETVRLRMGTGYKAEVQRTVNALVVENLIKLSANDNSSHQVKAIVNFQLNNLLDWLKAKLAANRDSRAHYEYLELMIQRYFDRPEEFEFNDPLNPPAGSPIGMGYRCESPGFVY